MGARMSMGQRVGSPITVYPPGARVRLSDGTNGTIMLVELADPRPYLVEAEVVVERNNKPVIVRTPIKVTAGDFTVTAYPASSLQVFGGPQSGSPVPLQPEGAGPAEPQVAPAVSARPSAIAGIGRMVGVGAGDLNPMNAVLGVVLVGAAAYYLTQR